MDAEWTLEDYDALTRLSFEVFLARSFVERNPGTPFSPNWHVDLMAAQLDRARVGQNPRLILNVPPRSLKSHAASIAFPAFVLGHDPSAQIIGVSYSAELAHRFARETRELMQCEWYRRVFPNTRLSTKRLAAHDFETTAGGFRLATSVGGTLVGRGADIIIIDDPLKPDEAASEVSRKAVNDWLDNSLLSRLNDKARGVIVIAMQRLHQKDLVGHVLAQGTWWHICLPAIAQHDEQWVIESPLGTYEHHRRAGEALHPAREDLESLRRTQAQVGDYIFAGQYLQAPIPPGGGMVKEAWFGTFDPDDPPKFQRIIQSWDSANKVSEISDYSVCTTWGEANGKLYLLDVFRARLEYPELRAEALRLIKLYDPAIVLVEDRASGTQLAQELRRAEQWCVVPITPEGEKAMRMAGQTAFIADRRLLLPARAPWKEAYIAELVTFPYAEHDDQVDSTSQALSWFQKEGDEPMWFPYMRQETARLEDERTRPRRMRPNLPTSNYYGITGKGYFSAPDGTFLLSAEDAEVARRQGWREVTE
jgi:predicted phage terminase large subunit-like protein